jgi:hypothetical protein
MPQLLCIFILGASLVMLSAGGADPQDAAAPRPVAAPGSPAAAARPFGEAAVAEDAPAVHSGFPSAKQHTRAVGNALVHGYLGRDPDFAQLTGLGTGRGKRGWATWRRGDWPDIGLRFKATAPKGPHWPVYHLDTKWQAQALWAIRPPSALESRQDAGFGSLYCLTYALPEQAAIVREYAFVPVAGRADPDWHYYLELGPAPETQDGTHASYRHGGKALSLQVPGWYSIAGRHTPPGTPLEVAGWSADPQADGGVSWRCAVAYRAAAAGTAPPDLDLSPAGLARLRQAALGGG